MVRVPKYCLICGACWIGGHAPPFKPMTEGLRVFYECGASISCKTLSEGIYQLLTKNCFNDKPANKINYGNKGALNLDAPSVTFL